MKTVGFTNIPNHFHDFRNYGSGSRSFSKFMEMVENVGFANIVHRYIFQHGVAEFAVGRSYVFMRGVLQTGPVRCSHPRLKQVYSLFNAKLGNSLCLKTVLWEQHCLAFLFIMYRAILHVYDSKPYYGKLLLNEHAYDG